MPRRSKTSTADMVQSAVWLPHGMHERLKQAGGNRGLGEEIRRRLEASFVKEDAADPKTRALQDVITKLAEFVALDAGQWHEQRGAFEIFRAGVVALLAHWEPAGEAGFQADIDPDREGKRWAQVVLSVTGERREAST